MATSHSIRTATVDDIPLIRELCFNVWPQTYAGIISAEQIEYMLELMYSPASLRKQMEDGATFLIINDGEEAVGFASFQEIKSAVYKLHKLYVLPSQQGKGTGRHLVEYICNEISAKGANALQLQVNKNNKAKQFYNKLGFIIVEELKLDIGNGYYMDDYIMELKLEKGS
ncbi:MAG: GNAT family N-acetyltransferase [Chitinophagaceae bacterium]|nr:GNAT family N-acetyltransferase [Chitinophagaceae bacterium]